MSGRLVLPLYVVEPNYWAQPFASARQWAFIRECLTELREALSTLGQPLIIRVGDVVDVLKKLSETYDVHTLHAHEESGNMWTFKRDLRVIDFCKSANIHYHEYPYNGIVRRLKSRDVWASIRNKRMAQPLMPIPRHFADGGFETEPLPLVSNPMFGDDHYKTIQKGGRKAAEALLVSFLEDRSKDYLYTISKPGGAEHFSSRLSPYLTWGVLSAREVHKALKHRKATLSPQDKKRFGRHLTAFTSRLSWRCHFIQKIEDQPLIEFECMHPAFEDMRPKKADPELFKAWITGQTGYPLIDACMRCLTETGWLPFRMRAMVVSFASYNLWLDWRVTGKHLARMFTDYEPGIHYSQLQMQSGVTGINAIRIYNPIKQSQDHDPNGRFIKHYVPELRDIPEDWIHEPWKMPALLQQSYGVIIGEDYPMPCVDREQSMRFARAELKEARQSDAFRETSQKVYQKLGSRRRQPRRRKRKLKAEKGYQMNLF